MQLHAVISQSAVHQLTELRVEVFREFLLQETEARAHFVLQQKDLKVVIEERHQFGRARTPRYQRMIHIDTTEN